MPQEIFREESLASLNSPEELDRLLVVVDRRAWLILFTLATICAASMVWAIFGRVPVRVEGVGVLVNPGNVKGIQSPASGQITSVLVRNGQHILQGEVISLVDQPELRKELDQLRAKRADIEVFQQSTTASDNVRQKMETEAFEKQRNFILAEMEKSEALSTQLVPEQQYRLSDLSLRLMQLDIGLQRLTQELLENQNRRAQELVEVNNAIACIELRLDEESRILSNATGTILEVAVQPGQIVGRGTRVGTIAMDHPQTRLTNLCYFSVRDGKRIMVGDAARVTPSTVQRERVGSILGVVKSVSAFPMTQESVVNDIGNAQIAQALLENGRSIQVEIELERDPSSFSGFRWTSKGPNVKFTPGTTSTARITIEQHAPITYVLPILRGWFLGESDPRNPLL
jgi:HlyD family secretion protein